MADMMAGISDPARRRPQLFTRPPAPGVRQRPDGRPGFSGAPEGGAVPKIPQMQVDGIREQLMKRFGKPQFPPSGPMAEGGMIGAPPAGGSPAGISPTDFGGNVQEAIDKYRAGGGAVGDMAAAGGGVRDMPPPPAIGDAPPPMPMQDGGGGATKMPPNQFERDDRDPMAPRY